MNKISVLQPKIAEGTSITFTEHAQLRCIERGVSVDEVNKVLRMPEKTFIDYSGAFENVAHVGARRVEVIFKGGENKIVIITVIAQHPNLLRGKEK